MDEINAGRLDTNLIRQRLRQYWPNIAETIRESVWDAAWESLKEEAETLIKDIRRETAGDGNDMKEE